MLKFIPALLSGVLACFMRPVHPRVIKAVLSLALRTLESSWAILILSLLLSKAWLRDLAIFFSFISCLERAIRSFMMEFKQWGLGTSSIAGLFLRSSMLFCLSLAEKVVVFSSSPMTDWCFSLYTLIWQWAACLLSLWHIPLKYLVWYRFDCCYSRRYFEHDNTLRWL